MTVKLGSLFDGSGGFPLAGAINGIEPVWASEIEKYPVEVTKARFPKMKHLGSILEINGGEIEPVDIVTGGSPCQDLSVAGKRDGLIDGGRSNLFFEMIRIIKEMRIATNGLYPRIVLWENVPGAFSSNKGKDFQRVIEEFCNVADDTVSIPEPQKGKWLNAGQVVGDGYSVAWRTFDAQYWGVPQRRKRIYLIADFGSERAGEILFEPESVRGDSAQGGTAREGVAGNVEGSVRRSNCLTPWDVQSRQVFTDNGPWSCLYGGQGGGHGYALISPSEGGVRGSYVYEPMSALEENWTESSVKNALRANASKSSHAVCFKERAGCPGGGKGILCGDKPFTLSTLTDQAVCYAVDGYNQSTSETAGTIRAGKSDQDHVGAICYPIDLIRESRGAFEAYEGNAKIGGSLKQSDNKGAQVVCYPINTMVATRWNADDGRTTFGVGGDGDPQFTLGAAHEHAVCYSLDRASFNQGINAQYKPQIEEELASALVAKGPSAVCYPTKHQGLIALEIEPVVYAGVSVTSKMNAQNPQPGDPCPTLHNDSRNYLVDPVVNRMRGFGDYEQDDTCSAVKARDYKDATDLVVVPAKPPRKYIIRRLTPLECCRLQGFPDWWEDGAHGSDSARYKMWGNGIALPNAAHVVRQAKKLLTSDKKDRCL